MVQTEFLRYVTIPANRHVCSQHMPEIIQIDFTPRYQLPAGAAERWAVIYPVKL
jgi:hypothetical protein